jgi:hypothetical protein
MITLKRQPLRPPQKPVVMPGEKAPHRPHLIHPFARTTPAASRQLDRLGRIALELPAASADLPHLLPEGDV